MNMETTRNFADLKAEVAAHIAADAVVKGTYWDGSKGCFIGCLTHSDRAEKVTERFRIPLPLVRICENIFEAMPDGEGVAFFAAFPDAVGRDGKDLSRVHWQFLAAELRALPDVPSDIQGVIDPIIAGMDLLAGGDKWPNAADAARAAVYAARAAADAVYAAADAARAAADAVYAATFADRAAYAADAVYAVAYATFAARAADYAAVRIRQRDTILRLIAEAD